jgi:hypothetical protein
VTLHEHNSETWRRVILGDGTIAMQRPPAITTAELDLVGAPAATWQSQGDYDEARIDTVASDTSSRDATRVFPRLVRRDRRARAPRAAWTSDSQGFRLQVRCPFA